MKNLLSIVAIIILATPCFSQLENMDFHDELQLKFSVRFAGNKAIGPPEDSIKNASGILVRSLELDNIRYGQGGYQASHRWAFLTEALAGAFIDAINGGGFEWGTKNTSTNIGDFILGWHNHAWSLYENGQTQIMGGLHWGDYFFGFEPYRGNKYSFDTAKEPAGWYGALGPALMADYAITNGMALHFEGSYAFTMKWGDFPDMTFDRDYPSPHFINLGLQLRTNSIFYGGMEYIRSIDRGDHNTNCSRTDLFVGLWF